MKHGNGIIYKVIIKSEDHYNDLINQCIKAGWDTPKKPEKVPYAFIVDRVRKNIRLLPKRSFPYVNGIVREYYPSAKIAKTIVPRSYPRGRNNMKSYTVSIDDQYFQKLIRNGLKVQVQQHIRS